MTTATRESRTLTRNCGAIQPASGILEAPRGALRGPPQNPGLGVCWRRKLFSDEYCLGADPGTRARSSTWRAPDGSPKRPAPARVHRMDLCAGRCAPLRSSRRLPRRHQAGANRSRDVLRHYPGTTHVSHGRRTDSDAGLGLSGLGLALFLLIKYFEILSI